MSILDRDNKHLFLERQNNIGNSFVVNVNICAKHIDDIITVSHNIEHVVTVSEHIDHVVTVSEHIDNVDIVALHINKVDTVADNIVSVNICSDNIENINTVSEHIDSVNKIAPYTSEIDTVAHNIYAVITLYEWNVPELARKIESDRITTEEKSAIAVEYADRAVETVEKARSLFEANELALLKMDEIAQDWTSFAISLTNDISVLTGTIIDQSTRITKHQLECREEIIEFKSTITDTVNEYQASIENKINEYQEETRKQIDAYVTRIDAIEDRVESDEVNSASIVATLTETDIDQSTRITKIQKEVRDNVDRLNNEITRLDTQIIENEINTVESISKLTDTDISQSKKITEVANELNTHIINDCERFTNLSYASVVHTRILQELQDFKINEALSNCLAVADTVLTNLIQSLRFLKMYVNGTFNSNNGIQDGGVISDLGVISNEIVDPDDTDDIFIDMGIIPDNP